MEQREFDALPARIDALEAEQRALQARIASPAFYREPAAEIRTALARADALKDELETLFERWAALGERAR